MQNTCCYRNSYLLYHDPPLPRALGAVRNPVYISKRLLEEFRDEMSLEISSEVSLLVSMQLAVFGVSKRHSQCKACIAN